MDATADRRRRPTQQGLVRAALGLYRRRGIAATGVAEICTRAGVTKGVFSHHFPNGKDDLTIAVIDANSAQVREGFKTAAATGRPPAALVRGLFSGYASLMATKGGDFGCPIAASIVDVSATSPAVRAAACAAFRSWRDDLEPLIGADLADIVVASLEGAILVARAENDAGVMRRVGRRLSTLIEQAAS
jgi:AcrR family transcriptional regulator